MVFTVVRLHGGERLVPTGTDREDGIMSTPTVPKYAAGLEIPISHSKRAVNLVRGDWVIFKWGESLVRVGTVNEVEVGDTKVVVQLCFFTDRDRKYPHRVQKTYKRLESVVVVSDSVSE